VSHVINKCSNTASCW